MAEPATGSTALNLLLASPGFFPRYLCEVGFLASATLGFGTSLFLELTQSTVLNREQAPEPSPAVGRLTCTYGSLAR